MDSEHSPARADGCPHPPEHVSRPSDPSRERMVPEKHHGRKQRSSRPAEEGVAVGPIEANRACSAQDEIKGREDGISHVGKPSAQRMSTHLSRDKAAVGLVSPDDPMPVF